MSRPGTVLGREPALWVSAVRAVLVAGVLFGLDLTEAQTAGLLLAAEAVLALWTRSEVTPNAAVIEREHDGQVLAGPAADQATPGAVVRDYTG